MIFLKDGTLLTFTFFAIPLSDHFTLGFVISKNNDLFQVQNKHKKLLLSGLFIKTKQPFFFEVAVSKKPAYKRAQLRWNCLTF